jgi:predicted SAM-dependent methyltransferase
MRMNIGAGADAEEGWIPWDIAHGNYAQRITMPDGCIEEIRASHVLEHIARVETLPTLKEWRRVLKPGGRLFVAVPDFDRIVSAMGQGIDDPNMEAYIMGGQTDVHDFHCAIFNESKLRQLLEMAGFQRIAEVGKEGQKWNCSHHWCSLNMEAFA